MRQTGPRDRPVTTIDHLIITTLNEIIDRLERIERKLEER